MKIRVTMKDPDTLYEATTEAVAEDVKKLSLSEDEAEAIEEKRRNAVNDLASKWFEYGEYLTVEIDTDAKTCVVVERST